MKYNTGLLEDFVYKVYTRIEVSDASQLDLLAIAQALDISVFLHSYPTQAIMNDGRHYVFINHSTPKAEWWEVFGHILLHAGDQRRLPLSFVEYQEWQADLFALHFCIPTFMLLSDDLPNDCRRATADVAERYGVSLPFAYERLKIHKQKLFDQKFHMKSNDYGLLFSSPLSNSKVVGNRSCNMRLKRHCETLGINQITVHGLRHTHASILIYKGVSIYYVSERLGHSTIHTAISTYTHLLKELKEKEVDQTLQTIEQMVQG